KRQERDVVRDGKLLRDMPSRLSILTSCRVRSTSGSDEMMGCSAPNEPDPGIVSIAPSPRAIRPTIVFLHFGFTSTSLAFPLAHAAKRVIGPHSANRRAAVR